MGFLELIAAILIGLTPVLLILVLFLLVAGIRIVNQ